MTITYEDVSKESGRRSLAWKHFLLNKETEKAKCKVSSCEKILNAKNGSTRGLLQHLKIYHDSETNDGGSTSKKKSINTFMVQKTREQREEDDLKYK